MYKNPVERVMSLLNLGLQSIRVMCQEMSEENEKLIKNCNSMEEIRNAAIGLQALLIPLCLLTEVTNQLKLKDKPESPCMQEEIEDLWEKVHEIDPSVQRTDSKQALCAKEIHFFHQNMWRRRMPFLQTP